MWAALLLSISLLVSACGADEPAPTEVPDDTETAEDPGEPDEDPEAEPAEPLGPETTLRLGHGFPAEHVLQRELLEPWADEVAAATGDTVSIEIHPGGSLTEAVPTYENTVAGVADIGWAIQGYTPGRFPVTEIVELPLLFESAEQATEALWELYGEFPEFEQEYQDVRVLALWTLSPGLLWTRGTQVTDMEDVAGLQLRAPGPVQIGMLEALGATPLTMPAPEIYDALERGVMEGLLIDPVGVAAFGLADVLDYGLDAGFYTTAMFLVMNQQTWDALSGEQQAAVDDLAGRELSLRIARVFDDASSGVMAGVEGDVELTALDDLEAWRNATSGVIDDWIADREAEGHPAQQMYERLSDHLDLQE